MAESDPKDLLTSLKEVLEAHREELVTQLTGPTDLFTRGQLGGIEWVLAVLDEIK